MARRIREEIVDDIDPVTTRVVTERRMAGSGFGPSFAGNPLGAMLAAVLVILLLVLVFGVLV